MNSETKWTRLFWYWIVGFAILRLVVASQVGLTTDEAHYFLYGQYLDWSYFDHPPLVGWIHGLFSFLPKAVWAARLPAVLLGVFASWSLWNFFTKKGYSHPRVLWAVIAVNVSFLLSLLSVGLLPDTLLMALVFPLLMALDRVEERPNHLISWAILGLVLGLAGLSKYTAVFFIPGMLWYLVWQRRLGLLRNPRWLVAAVVAALLVFPVFYWNWINDWASFRYQGEHVVGRQDGTKSVALSLLLQFVGYSPPLFFLAFWGLGQAIKGRLPGGRMVAAMALPLILFFAYSSFTGVVLPHWVAPAYFLLLPISLIWVLGTKSVALKKFFIGGAVLTGLLQIIIFVELVFKFNPGKDFESLHRDLYGWPAIMEQAEALASGAPIAVGNWTLGSRAHYYQSKGGQIFVFDKRMDQFDFWEGPWPVGKDVLVISTHYYPVSPAEDLVCDNVSLAGKMDVVLRGKTVNAVQYFWCRNFQKLL